MAVAVVVVGVSGIGVKARWLRRRGGRFPSLQRLRDRID
jgi:hypothetical protein